MREGKKICNKCKQEKDLIDFSKNKATKDGLSYNCKSCMKTYQEAYRKIKEGERLEERLKKKEERLKKEKEKQLTEGKVCSTCKIKKRLNEFEKDKRKFLGKGARCLSCINIKNQKQSKKRKIKKIEKVKSTGKKKCKSCKGILSIELFDKNKNNFGDGYYTRCNPCREKRADENLKRGKEKRIELYDREENTKKMREYRARTIEARREYAKKYMKERLDSDPAFRLSQNQRTVVNIALKGNKKSNNTLKLLGCTPEELKAFIESKFKPFMNWDNYGVCTRENRSGWDVDHIQPLSTFDLSDPEQQKIAFHYTNLQPLCSYINRYEKRDQTFSDWVEDKPFYFFRLDFKTGY